MRTHSTGAGTTFRLSDALRARSQRKPSHLRGNPVGFLVASLIWGCMLKYPRLCMLD